MRSRYRPRLVVMVKEPRMGRVKSRLARDAGAVAATRFLRFNLAAAVARLARDPRWETILAVSPDAQIRSAMFPGRTRRIGQGSGDLGERLTRVANSASPGPLIIIGADIPGICASDIAAAFKALLGRDAVLGPSGDGGYWLIGLNHKSRRIPPFGDVRWSTLHARADTIRNLAGARIAVAEKKDDVDTGSDLLRLGGSSGRIVQSIGH